MDIKEVNTAIIRGDFSTDELASIIDAVKYARSLTADKMRYTIAKGSKVKFRNTRVGREMTGVVESIARKNASVDCGVGHGKWRVPLSMLEPVPA